MARTDSRSKSHEYAMQFIVQSMAVFFGVYFALIIVKFLERMDVIALLLGAVFGAFGILLCAKIILRGIDLKK